MVSIVPAHARGCGSERSPQEHAMPRCPRALLALAGVLALAGCVEPPPMSPRAPTPGVPHVTITSFNVNLDMHDDPSTVAAIGATDADVVCLQEVNAGWRAVLRTTWHEAYPYMAFEGDASGGLAVLSRYPFVDRGVHIALDDWHPAWHIEVDSPIGALQVLQVHLRPPYSRRGGIGGLFDVDEDHLLEIDGYSAQCDDEVATVVVGDFNEGVGGPAIERLESRGYVNALPAFRPGQETWRYGRGLYGQTVDTIDHILYQADRLDPLDAYVKDVGRSDHLPVTVLLERVPTPADDR